MPVSSAESRREAVFAALADPTRSLVLKEVATRGSATATQLAASLPVSRQAVLKHLRVLDEAGLVTFHRAGKEVRYEARLHQLRTVARWLDQIATQWEQRLARLKAIAERSGSP